MEQLTKISIFAQDTLKGLSADQKFLLPKYFYIESFRHLAQYSEQSGETKSFLISNWEQSVYIAALEKKIHFHKNEAIYMELSQKFDLETIQFLAHKYGFKVEKNFTDRRNYFVDSLWVKK